MRGHRKEKILRIGGLCAGLIAAVLLLGAYSPPVMDWLTVGGDEIGEAYRNTKIHQFRETIPDSPPRLPREAYVGVDQARVYTIGDSFFWMRLGYHDFPTQLQLDLGEPVVHLGHRDKVNPVRAMKYAAADTDRKRVLVLSTVERYIRETFDEPYELHPVVRSGARANRVSYTTRARLLRRWMFLELEKRLQYLLEYNHLSFFLASQWATFSYNSFGAVDEWAGLVADGDVFIAESTSRTSPRGVFSPVSQEEVERIATHISEVREELLTTYHTDLVVMLIPNKITLHHEHAEHAYNELIPRLTRALRVRGVPCVDLYKAYQKADTPLYYRSDPHWNEAGRRIAFQKLIPVLRERLSEPALADSTIRAGQARPEWTPFSSSRGDPAGSDGARLSQDGRSGRLSPTRPRVPSRFPARAGGLQPAPPVEERGRREQHPDVASPCAKGGSTRDAEGVPCNH